MIEIQETDLKNEMEEFCELIPLLAAKYRLDSRLGLVDALEAKAREYQEFLSVVASPALAEVFEKDISSLLGLANDLKEVK